jgi:hypothetical protein
VKNQTHHAIKRATYQRPLYPQKVLNVVQDVHLRQFHLQRLKVLNLTQKVLNLTTQRAEPHDRTS